MSAQSRIVESARAMGERGLHDLPAPARRLSVARVLPADTGTAGATLVLSGQEREDLLRAIESARGIGERRRFALWAQGALQTLLPHQVMVCLHLGASGQVLHSETLHARMLAPALLRQLSDPLDGLAVRLARHCRGAAALPCWSEGFSAPAAHPLAPFRAELRACGYPAVLLHGSAAVAGGSSVFVLFGMAQGEAARQAYFLELLLPHLHLALLGLGAQMLADGQAPGTARAVSQRELEILHWVGQGKSNHEVGLILGISALTVKNHLQRIYRTLGVSNRTQAVARGLALRLPQGRPAQPLPA